MPSIQYQLRIAAKIADVFHRLSTREGLASWWCTPEEERVDDRTIWLFQPGQAHGMLKIHLVEAIPHRKVIWEKIHENEALFNTFNWSGKRITFELMEVGEYGEATHLTFDYDGWDAGSRYLGFCQQHWERTLQALRQVCEDLD